MQVPQSPRNFMPENWVRPGNPPTRPTKKKQENEDLTTARISFMAQDEKGEKEQDDIDLALSAVGKLCLRNLSLKSRLKMQWMKSMQLSQNTSKVQEPRGLVFLNPALHLRLFTASSVRADCLSCTTCSANATTSTPAQHGPGPTTILMCGH